MNFVGTQHTLEKEHGRLSDHELVEEIHRLKEERNAVILAHYYQQPEIQELADFVGDSLALAQAAEKTGAGTILPASTEVALIVQVPTDAGPYNVSLSRPNAESAWLADRIRPAEG